MGERPSVPHGAGQGKADRPLSRAVAALSSLKTRRQPAGSASVADRFSLETAFRDVEEIVGAGQQQVLFIGANLGAFHLGLWTYTMTEAWGRDDLVDRSASPWDNPNRRPSHADILRAWRRQLLGEEIRTLLRPGLTQAEIEAAAERLLQGTA